MSEKRFSTMAYNASVANGERCKVSMEFSFGRPYPIQVFLKKIDLPNIFNNVEGWVCAQISFRISAIDNFNNYFEKIVDIRISLVHMDLKDIGDHILAEFEKYNVWSVRDVKIEHMLVSFR